MGSRATVETVLVSPRGHMLLEYEDWDGIGPEHLILHDLSAGPKGASCKGYPNPINSAQFNLIVGLMTWISFRRTWLVTQLLRMVKTRFPFSK